MGPSHTLGALALLGALSLVAAGFAPHPRLQMHQITREGLGVAAPSGPVAREPERYSGYFQLNRTYDANMFFFFFEARDDPDNAPVVLWMTGEPPCRPAPFRCPSHPPPPPFPPPRRPRVLLRAGGVLRERPLEPERGSGAGGN